MKPDATTPILPIGDHIRALRRKAGLTQQQLARKSKLSGPFISELESGRNPNPGLQTLTRIADAMDTPVAELLDENAAWSERVRALERVANAAVRHQRRYLLTSPEANDLARALLELVETGWEPEEE